MGQFFYWSAHLIAARMLSCVQIDIIYSIHISTLDKVNNEAKWNKTIEQVSFTLHLTDRLSMHSTEHEHKRHTTFLLLNVKFLRFLIQIELLMAQVSDWIEVN